MITIAICDDQEIVIEGLKTILDADDDIQVIVTAEHGQDLLDKIMDNHPPDLILMDLKMPVMNGIQTTRKVKNQYPSTKILILTTFDDDQLVMDSIRAGASGYLLKDTQRMDLIDAVKGTMSGQSFIDPSVAGKIMSMAAGVKPRPTTSDAPEIRPREREILVLIARGFSNSDIAKQLLLSEGTVRNYASILFNRMGVTDRTQAAVTALRYGIINLDET